MRDSKILITGVTGQVASPVARALAGANEVWGIARFTDATARADLEQVGIRCQAVNLAAGDFTEIPSDFDYVLNFAVAKSGNWDKDLAANAESVGLLMAHCRAAKAFLHCSSAAVYDPPDNELRTENAALGDNHKFLFPTYSISKIAGEVVVRSMARVLELPATIARLNVPYGNNGGWPFFHTENAALGDNHKFLFPTYSISKIAGEVVVRSMARVLELPATIARLNVPYGNNGGWPFFHMEMMLAGIPIPVPPGGPARYNPIHEDDIIATIPKLFAAASVPATTVNWAGDQIVSLQDWCGYLGTLIGKEPVFQESDSALRPNPVDVTRMHELIGNTAVDWHDGMRRLVAKFHPEAPGL